MLAFGFSVSDFITDAFSAIFISLLDNGVYALLAYVYRIWVGLTKLDLFGGSEAGMEIYNTFTKNIYRIISIVMIFIFSYRLLMRVMDPDGSYSPKESAWSFIKRIIFSVILVIVCPLIFRYMSAFQYHVVSDDTIPKMILNLDNEGNGNNHLLDNGKQLAMITLMSFYHPYETSYDTFVVNTGAATCDEVIVDEGNLANDTQKDWREAMYEWCDDTNAITPNKILWNRELRKTIGDEDGCEYYWVICTACGCVIIYFLIQYSIAIGTRAVRLGFLEIVAPVPLLLRMFGPEKFFQPWFKEIKKTYLELFIRIAIISFVIFLCTLVPMFIQMIAAAF